MAAKKFLTHENGKLKEKTATVVSTGAAKAGEIVALDDAGKLDLSVMPNGIAPLTENVVASENLSAGNFVNLWDDAGTMKARKADATNYAKKADGYVLSAVTSGEVAMIYFEDFNDQLSGLTAGLEYFLSDTSAGGVSTTPPTTATAGKISQLLGKALSATKMSIEIEGAIELA